MVDHLTRIVLKPFAEPAWRGAIASATPAAVRLFGDRVAERAARAAAIMEALAARGFDLRLEKDRIVAESTHVEAQEAKAYLLSLGFRDREFQVVLEYARRWGVL